MPKPSTPKRVHIFKSGKHTPMKGGAIEFSDQVVSNIAVTYDPALSEAPVVIGHPTLDAPAYGWVKSLSAEGGQLFADLDQLNADFSDAVEAGNYKKVSASFFEPTAPNNPVPGGYYLRHVGFLGAAAPAVKGLQAIQFSDNDEGIVTIEFADISGWMISDIGRLFGSFRDFLIEKFGSEDVNDVISNWQIDGLIETGAFEAGKDAATETPVTSSFADPQKSKTAPEAKMTHKKPDPGADTRTAELDTREQALATRELEFSQSRAKTEADTFVSDLVTKGKVLPAQKDKLVNFMAGLSDEDTVSFSDGGTEKTATNKAVFKEILIDLPKRVDFSEQTKGKAATDSVSFACPSGFNVDQDKVDLHSRAIALQNQNPGMAYLDAVKQS